jgi:hypothetical protein
LVLFVWLRDPFEYLSACHSCLQQPYNLQPYEYQTSWAFRWLLYSSCNCNSTPCYLSGRVRLKINLTAYK